MKAIDILRKQLAFANDQTEALIGPMREAPLTSPTPRGGNHPLWVLGHLACSEAGLTSLVDGQPSPIVHLDPLFQGGTEPTSNPSDYPSIDEVFTAYRETRTRTLKLLDAIGDSGLDAAPKLVPPGLEDFFQTVGDVFALIPVHQTQHLGQVADARRAAGLKPLR